VTQSTVSIMLVTRRGQLTAGKTISSHRLTEIMMEYVSQF